MTGPEDSHGSTRPISVAELLARNGTIGAPPIGGRRRRRRGDSDSVTVAELTGEIPIVEKQPGHDVNEPGAPSTNGVAHVEPEPAAEPAEDEHADEHEDEPAEDEHAAEHEDEDEHEDADHADAVADYVAHIKERDTDEDPLEFFEVSPRRPSHTPGKRHLRPVGRGAEQMSPDPVDEDEDMVLARAPGIGDEDTEDAEVAVEETGIDELPSYLRSSAGTLFGGQTVADDAARRGAPPHPGVTDLEDDDLEDDDLEDDDLEDDVDAVAAPSGLPTFLSGAWVVGQSVIAVVFGAGLFIAFDQLWMWNNIVALVLSVLVILGLVVGVRVVRKTEDIGSTLFAVAVGALVTLGPLALLQSG
jgi:hypothetical protein